MDMYQKREMRKKKNIEKSNNNTAKTNINWVIPPFVNYLTIPLISRD